MLEKTLTDAPPQSPLTITNVRLAHALVEKAAATLWRVECHDGRVTRLAPLPTREEIIDTSCEIDANGGIMLPS
jgi:hypothetical protein